MRLKAVDMGLSLREADDIGKRLEAEFAPGL
jgi:hypothetical protein